MLPETKTYWCVLPETKTYWLVYQRRRPTGVDHELVGESWVIHVMDGAGKQDSHDLQAGEDRLVGDIYVRLTLHYYTFTFTLHYITLHYIEFTLRAFSRRFYPKRHSLIHSHYSFSTTSQIQYFLARSLGHIRASGLNVLLHGNI